MTRELEVLMNAPSHSGMSIVILLVSSSAFTSMVHNLRPATTDGLRSGFMAHATIMLMSDKCWQADIHHIDLPDIAVIHIPAFTTTEVKQVRFIQHCCGSLLCYHSVMKQMASLMLRKFQLHLLAEVCHVAWPSQPQWKQGSIHGTKHQCKSPTRLQSISKIAS